MHCPTCAADLGDRVICPNCGSLPRVELALARARDKANGVVERTLATLPRRFQPHHFLWLCALMPLAVLPPAVSLTYALFRMRRRDDLAATETNVEWLAIVSLINLVLTGILLYRFHITPGDVIAYIGSIIRSILSFRLFWGPPSTPSVPPLTPA